MRTHDSFAAARALPRGARCGRPMAPMLQHNERSFHKGLLQHAALWCSWVECSVKRPAAGCAFRSPNSIAMAKLHCYQGVLQLLGGFCMNSFLFFWEVLCLYMFEAVSFLCFFAIDLSGLPRYYSAPCANRLLGVPDG